MPLILPVALSYGVDPIHFGVMLCLTLSLGLLTPPVGAGLFVAAAAADVDLVKLMRAMVPFILVSMFVILLIIFFPWLTLGLL